MAVEMDEVRCVDGSHIIEKYYFDIDDGD